MGASWDWCGGNQPNKNNLWRVAEAGLQNLWAGHFHLQAWKELWCSTPLFWLALWYFSWPTQGKGQIKGSVFPTPAWVFSLHKVGPSQGSLCPLSASGAFFYNLKFVNKSQALARSQQVTACHQCSPHILRDASQCEPDDSQLYPTGKQVYSPPEGRITFHCYHGHAVMIWALGILLLGHGLQVPSLQQRSGHYSGPLSSSCPGCLELVPGLASQEV